MRLFLIVSFLLTMLPASSIAAMQFLMARQWEDAALAVLGWLAFPGLYWWPLGAWLFRGPGTVLLRIALGYVLSLPLFLLCLWLVYPAFGYRFDPGRSGMWPAYLSASPWFYGYILVLWFLMRRDGRVARATGAIVAVLFVAATAAPLAGSLAVDRFRPPTSAIAPTRIVNARIVDTVAGTIVDGKEVHLRDGRIAAIVDASSPAENNAQTIDAAGAYLVPGLIDVHAHLQTPLSRIGAPFSVEYMVGEMFGLYAQHRREYLAHGVTSVRDLGGPAAAARELRDALTAGQLAGPRLFTVGRLVTAPGGHPVSTIWTPQISAAGAILASDAATLERELQADCDSFAPDAVKIVFGTIGQAPARLRDNLLHDAITFATSRGLPSIVHAERSEEVAAAVQAGATGVEHLALLDALPETLLTLLRERRPFVDATFGVQRFELEQRGETKDAVASALARARTTINTLFTAGVPIVVGTDAPLVAYGSGLHEELAELRQAGLPPAAILRSVTVTNAAYLGRADTLGRVAPGFEADLMLISRNPLEDVVALRTPHWTMVGGIVMWQTADSPHAGR